MITLTQKFNQAVVKKGETFQVELTEGGIANLHWDVAVVSGQATQIDKISKEITPPYASDTAWAVTTVFRADETGDIDIEAKARGASKGLHFKVQVTN